MKNNTKTKILSIVCSCLLVVICILVCFYKQPITPLNEQKENYKAIIEIWQIDTFEGGVGSRTAFLRNVANSFSKKYKSLLFLVSSHTIESANNLINKGVYPDLISYGGNSLNVVNKLQNIKGYSQKDGGEINNNRYMLAWCKGGYFEIKRSSVKTPSKVIVSEGEFNSGSVAKLFSNYSNFEGIAMSPKEGYNAFLNDKNALLIGTQRDIFRLKSREVDFVYSPISEYCDMYQYISVVYKNNEKSSYLMTFLNYLCSEQVQKTLTKIGMYSCIYDNLYLEDENMNSIKNENVNYVTSPYADKNRLNEIKRIAQSAKSSSEIINFLKHL